VTASPVDNIVARVQQLTLEADSFAYLAIDAQGLLLDQGGELSYMSLPDWQAGENILDSALFLQSYIPMKSNYECIECFQLGDSCVIDVHLFNDDDCILVVLIDRSSEMAVEATLKQQRNELKLNQRRARKQKGA